MKNMVRCYEGHEVEIENYQPSTVDGWYGNIEMIWGEVGGIRVPMTMRVDCPICGAIVPVEGREYDESETGEWI